MKVTVQIKTGLLKDLKQVLKQLGRNWYCIITDENVYKHYGKDLPDDIDVIVKPAGEDLKKLKNIEIAAERLANLGLDRGSCLIALGGGVIGDFTGFLASVYMRGIPYIQMPTTLLSMVDSSIGGKTGVNLPNGKNLVGTFLQPITTLIDPEFLNTLPKKELLNGVAESIKHACIRDPKLFDFLKKNRKKILAKDTAILNKLITQSSAVKIAIVEKDEKEKGLRMLLNYGHTIGHAIEQASNYKISHGEAVSIGMHQVNLLSKAKNTEEIAELLKLYGLPTQIPRNISREKVKELIARDKKNISGKTTFVIVNEIGKAQTTNKLKYD
ncbi:3-dehydroquinate synthase [Candidatus Peregrinibacteria bacterium CG22_combo_CG10-13_8_21_14_all_44_10]|nr:MAG: 3-dehydroquinate synthase [Candidatus Peregrinibacteria bacterium CG2_30_44_17]PIP66369.1 MAG: 3-dehydroquinate synthase [Candidatus Peregrinibacteria bacterium CG22_combo_CG10-13_8_21_14_all_44_10]PIS04145.1 MAG: 3-dehydroquinate synthase [Candidatus Peregrinibacteria bacterium CG10_big_fil_rev_8_21_14_0_10_44_7]PIX79223.1 MAG: 3-dehydroquinate synthase [Candidatus Peregrinibacteria bacterium CG_4_10_14_3_um_filter_44_21]PJB89537.1 MAG: 3-dehydroquinate synthase [Candidatus Peregriniba